MALRDMAEQKWGMVSNANPAISGPGTTSQLWWRWGGQCGQPLVCCLLTPTPDVKEAQKVVGQVLFICLSLLVQTERVAAVMFQVIWAFSSITPYEQQKITKIQIEVTKIHITK